jgi:hypothetical protein
MAMRQLARVGALAGAAVLFLASQSAFAAPLGGGLPQLVKAFESNDTRLSHLLDLHLTNGTNDPLVRLHLAPGVTLDSVLPNLKALGFQLVAQSVIDPRLVEGYLPLGSARAAGNVVGLGSVAAVQKPHRNAGSVQSQAVAFEHADAVLARGIDGSGIRIGALSDSYNKCGPSCTTNAAQDIHTGDLPKKVTVLDEIFEKTDGAGTDEGRAILQLLHDIAPGSDLAFATAFHGEVSFANNIISLRNDFHADVITDDIIYFDEPMYSDGIVAQAVDVVSNDGAAYFSSAMNNGLEGYEAVYKPVSFAAAQALTASGKENVKLDQIPANIRPQTLHNFGNPDGSTAITQRISTDGENTLTFQWDEPFFVGKVKTDFNIYVFDGDGNWLDPNATGSLVFYTTDDNTQTDEAFEFVVLDPNPNEIHGGANVTDYQLVIGNVNGGGAQHVKYVNINGLAPSQRQNAPTTWGHAAARGGQGVAAAYYAIPNFPEDFSSPGPVTIFFDKDGNRLRKPEIRSVPQITAADGVDTTFFGFDSDFNGLPNFFGTSAAAPDAAAVAALMIEAAGGPGSLRPATVYTQMQRTASPIPLPDDRSFASAVAGPVNFDMNGDWTRWSRYFGLSVGAGAGTRSVKSVAFDTTGTGLIWNTNPNRFHVGPATGVTQADMTFTVQNNADLTAGVFTINFAPGSFAAGDSFRFGMSVFANIEGSTEEDPDRFRGMTVTVTFSDGSTATGTVTAGPKQAVNRFTGAGLVNADAAVKSVTR